MNLSDFGLVPHASKTMKPGDVFGRLTLLEVGKPPGTYRYAGVFRCDCGTVSAIRLDGIASGAVVSCGCYRLEVTTSHGCTDSPLQAGWRHMIRRCTDPTDPAWKNYGGRGIKVCRRWRDLANFVADMGPTYRPGLEIDRRDNDGNYTPRNCRWVTRRENCENRRTTRMFTIGGKTQSLTRWAEEYGARYQRVWDRVRNQGWSIERALTEPVVGADERMRRAREARRA